MKWLIWVVIALVLGAGSAALVVKLNSDAFAARVAALRAELAAAAALPSTGPPELPALVRDYALRAGGTVGGPALFVLHQKAQLFTSASQPPVALDTEQWTLTRQPGIVWSAAGNMYGLPVVVVDAFVAGRGVFDARLAATLKVAGGEGPDYDRGELMRWMSELPLHPDAILNVTGLVWQQLDARTVSVTAQSASGPATLRFGFDESGDIVSMVADDRPMDRGGVAVPTVWRGLFAQYRQFGAYRLPSWGEVGWELPEGLFTYWKGELTSYEARL